MYYFDSYITYEVISRPVHANVSLPALDSLHWNSWCVSGQGYLKNSLLCRRGFGACSIPKELVCARCRDKLALQQRVLKISAVSEARIEKVAHACRLSQAKVGTCRDVRGINEVERRGVVLGLVGKTLHATGIAW